MAKRTRSYEKADLEWVVFLSLLELTSSHLLPHRRLTKKQLAPLIQDQIEHWPGKRFNASKTTIQSMRDALLDPSNGFRKSESDEATTPDPPLSSDLSEATTPLAPTAATINAAPDVPLPADVVGTV